jgi:hypothetical protein
MALLGRKPVVSRIGENTQGVFSDVLTRHLPNGWSFGLPNEIYLTEDGKAFDGLGGSTKSIRASLPPRRPSKQTRHCSRKSGASPQHSRKLSRIKN